MIDNKTRDGLLESIGNVRRQTVDHLVRNDGADRLVPFVANLHRAVDTVVRQSEGGDLKPVCRVGCAYCCRHLRVEASEPELFYIARAVRQMPEEQFESTRQRLRAHVEAVAGQPSSRAPCAFLVENRCQIYAARPAVCRKAHSLSVEDCASGAAEIPQNLGIVLAAEALMLGTAAAYRDVGRGAAARELCAGLLAVLADPTAEARWLAGEAVFPD